MKPRDLANMGVPKGRAMKVAALLLREAERSGMKKEAMRTAVRDVIHVPSEHVDDPHFGALARILMEESAPPPFSPRHAPAPWSQWGENLDPASIEQMGHACELPVAVRGALMPDAHVGYGLPIGGVLATENAIIPYAVGVDIACRMKLTVLDIPVNRFEGEQERFARAIESETRFGIGAKFTRPREHAVMDADWSVTAITQQQKDTAWSQLGTSGSGNHFVEFGILSLDRSDLGLEAGEYLSLLSHSGSRGVGAQVAGYYSRLAMDQHPELPKRLQHLAWLELDSEAGREYWAAMNLMGEYAAANHAVIHREIARHLGATVLVDIENHHNFAWRETHLIKGEPRTLVVHRKGATPAGRDVLGIIPGSMASPAFVVRGTGSAASLESASHGAGRVMSRKAARRTFTWSDVQKQLADRRVTILSAGIDEVPGVYKDIHQVMSQQRDLVRVIARFDPRLVKMAPEGERAED